MDMKENGKAAASFLNRPELFDIINKNTSRVLFVRAKIGYGKSALFHAWADQYNPQASFLTLTEDDNRPERLNMRLACAAKESQVVILEDFYHIHTNASEEACLRAILQAPAGTQFIILSRRIRPVCFSELEAERDITYLTERDLALTLDETEDYLWLSGIRMAEEDIVELYGLTEGWPLLINCSIPEIRVLGGCIPDNYGFPQARASLRYVINRRVFNLLTEEAREFLMMLSLYPVFTTQLACVLTGRADAEQMIDWINRRSSFLESGGRNRWQINLFMLDYLRMSEHEIPGSLLDDAALRAGRFFEQQDNPLEALNAYFLRDHYEPAVTLLKKLLKNHPASEDYYALKPYLLKVPAHILQKEPTILAGLAVMYMLYYRVADSKRCYQQLLDMRSTLSPEFLEQERLELLILELNISMPYLCTDIALIGKIAKFAVVSGGRFNQKFTVTGGQPRVMAGSRDFCSWTKHMMPLKQALAKPLEALLGSSTNAIIQAGIAEAYYQYNQLNKAFGEASMAQASAVKSGAEEALFTAEVLCCQILCAQGEFEKAIEYAQKIREDVRQKQLVSIHANMGAYGCLLQLMKGEVRPVLEWMEENAPDEHEPFRMMDRYIDLIRIRAYLCAGRTDKALPLIELLLCYSQDYNRPYNWMESNVLKSICLEQMGEKEEAESALEDVLQQAERYKFVRVLADEGTGILPILERLHEAHKTEAFFEEVLTASAAFAKQYPSYYIAAEPVPQVVLTRSELNVLREMAPGKTNSEIAESLCLSQATVKTHLSKIYDKLEVRNRTGALRRAAELGIIKQ